MIRVRDRLGMRRRPQSTFQARTVPVRSLTVDDAAVWDRLAAQQFPRGNAFLSSTFARSAGHAYSGVGACFIEDDQGIAAILPYQCPSPLRRALRAAERVGEEMNDSFGIVARPNTAISSADLLALAGLNHLYFTHLDERQSAHGLTGSNPRPGLQIDIGSDSAAYWQALTAQDKKFAADTERRGRKAQTDLGAMRFVLAEDDPAPVLERILEYKRQQYLRTGKGDWLAKPGRSALLRALLAACAPDCRGIVSTLSYGTHWAAMHFGLLSRATLHYWIPVYNPELTPYAPGRLLLREIIRHAPQAGIEVIDRGMGDSAAKRDFPSGTRLYYEGAWHRANGRALTYRTIQSLAWRWAALGKSARRP